MHFNYLNIFLCTAIFWPQFSKCELLAILENKCIYILAEGWSAGRIGASYFGSVNASRVVKWLEYQRSDHESQIRISRWLTLPSR